MDQLRRGYLYGLGAYLCWGFFPIYFKELRPSGAVEILAHRVVWSVVFVALLLTVVRRWSGIRQLLRRPRTLLGIGLAAVLIGVNWGVYIYGVNAGHVVETSLGYFINPLVSVLFGMIFFGERLRPWQWVAIGTGAAAVLVLTVDYGRLPWIALSLAISFGSYGLVKKRLGLPPAEGLLLESSWLALPALGYLGWLSARGDSTFTSVSTAHTVLLTLAGVATAVPLLLFAGAANRVPLVGLGILQYLTPCIQLAVGVFLYHEPMPPARLAGFALVWVALAVFTAEALHNSARRRAASATRMRAEAAGQATV
jgi:chloramphenicol-sensitive protein RarD